MQYLVSYIYRRELNSGSGACVGVSFPHDPPTRRDIEAFQEAIRKECGFDAVGVNSFFLLSGDGSSEGDEI